MTKSGAGLVSLSEEGGEGCRGTPREIIAYRKSPPNDV